MNDTTSSTETPQSTSPAAQSLSDDSVFDILTAQRRRYVLHCLHTYDGPIALADVADEVAVWEQETDLPDIPAEDVKSVYISLYHTHIPKLADAGIVEYSQEQDSVALSEYADELQSHLDATEDATGTPAGGD